MSDRLYKMGYKALMGPCFSRMPKIRSMDPAHRMAKGRLKMREEVYKAVAVSLPFCLNGIAQPHPLTTPLENKRSAFQHRIASRSVDVNSRESKAAFRKFRMFTRHHMKKILTPLSSDTDVSYETWRSEINQTEARKCELDEAREQLDFVSEKVIMEVKAFIKDEPMDSFKYPRGIYSRSDFAKVLVGPYIRAMEKQVYKLPFFIKKVPVADRPKWMEDHFSTPGGIIIESDYTSFESSYTPQIMRILHMVYDYLLGDVPGKAAVMDFMRKTRSYNRVIFRNVTCRLLARRCSGEMDTSLGHALLNYFGNKWNCHEQGIEIIQIVIEGDDCVMLVTIIPVVTNLGLIGFIITWEVYDSYGEASFCGLRFVESNIVKDPIRTIMKMSWTSRQYVSASNATLEKLQIAKALSALYEAPACPVVNVFAQRILTCLKAKHSTESILETVNRKIMSVYEREKLTNALKAKEVPFREPSMATRCLVERRYGVGVSMQLAWEAQIRDTQPSHFSLPGSETYTHDDCQFYWQHYVTKNRHNFEFIGENEITVEDSMKLRGFKDHDLVSSAC